MTSPYASVPKILDKVHKRQGKVEVIEK